MRRAARLGLDALSLIFIVKICGSLPPWRLNLMGQVDRGEALIHGLPDQLAWFSQMPLMTVLAAFCAHLARARLNALSRAVFVATAALTGLASGTSASSIIYGLARVGSGYAQATYTLLVAVVGYALIVRARRPRWTSSLLVGLATGASLLFRAPLALFPPLLALGDLLGRYRRAWRIYWPHLACLCLVPYLFLVPWLRLTGHAFELHEVNGNIVAGALGFVQPVEGRWSALLDDPSLARDDAKLRWWAVRRVLRDPRSYLKAYARRLGYVFRLMPSLWLLAAAGLWLERRSRVSRQLALLIAYFVGIHCLLAVSPPYFEPLAPLLAIPVGRLLVGAWHGSAWPGRRTGPALAVALLLAPCCWTEAVILRHPIFAVGNSPQFASLPMLQDAIARTPTCAWLRYSRGDEFLADGELSSARDDYREALRLDASPDDKAELARLKLAWLDAVLDKDPRAMDKWRVTGPNQNAWHELKADVLLRLGRERDARHELAKTLSSVVIMRDASVDSSLKLQLDTTSPLLTFPVQLPADDERRLNLERSRGQSEPAAALIESTIDSLGMLPRADSLRRLAVAERYVVRSDDFWSLFSAYLEMGETTAAQRVLDRFSAVYPHQPLARLARARFEHSRGRDERALQSLAEVAPAALPPDALEIRDHLLREIDPRKGPQARRPEPRRQPSDVTPSPLREPASGRLSAGERLIARVNALWHWKRAMRGPKPASDVQASPAEPMIARALELAKLGRAPEASAVLDRALPLAPNTSTRLRIAILYQDLERYPKALRIDRELAEADPGNAVLASDLGVCAFLAGNDAEAAAAFERAIVLDPTRAEDYLSLGAVLERQKRFSEALSLYDKGLHAASPGSSARPELAKAHARLAMRR